MVFLFWAKTVQNNSNKTVPQVFPFLCEALLCQKLWYVCLNLCLVSFMSATWSTEAWGSPSGDAGNRTPLNESAPNALKPLG